MIASFARPLAIAAGVGWVGCIVVSLLGFAGLTIPHFAILSLSFGALLLGLCMVPLLQRQVAGLPTKGSGNVASHGTPRWVRYAIWATWGYGGLSILLTRGEPSETQAAGFVAMFYAASLGVFVTTWVTRFDPTECANGHPIAFSDKFCRECGAEIKRVRHT